MKKNIKKKKKQTGKGKYVFAFFLSIVFIIGGLIAFYKVRYPVKYQDEIAKYSDSYSLDRTMVASLINEESSFNPNAVSKVGAIGLMQITPSTGAFIANKLGETNYDSSKLFEPDTNIRYGCYYLKYLRDRFVDTKVVLTAYNAGETTVRMWLKDKQYSADGVTLVKIPYNVTNSYTTKILNGMKHYSNRI